MSFTGIFKAKNGIVAVVDSKASRVENGQSYEDVHRNPEKLFVFQNGIATTFGANQILVQNPFEFSSKVTNARCPVCHKKMEMVGEGEGQKFVCVCGYKEKLSAFKQRKEKQGSGMSKKEVNRYLKKQQKEAQEPINNAFAEAFSKIKL